MASKAESSMTWKPIDVPREYGNHHVGTVYATDNARIFLGNADRVNIGDDSEDCVRSKSDEKVLLKALYYEVMNHRRNQILSATKQTCEWIWTSDFRRFLADSTTKVFWIAGKPGSGKSTLMKYLASSLSELRRLLPSTWKYGNADEVVGISWTTVNFFFDFRLANKLGNSLEGLLRTLLYQFANALPGLIEKFAPDPSQWKEFSQDLLKAALDKALILLKDSMTHILILVDGLDEFAGKKRGILDFLLLLSEHENVKLCLASRPQSMIREKLAHVQSLSVSNHNNPGIRRFIRDATSEFQPRLNALRLSNIESLILKRALGVFLWVYYAVEATLQSYAEGATVDEIEAIIMEIPDELEAIYERILQEIPINKRPEAATVYILISEADFDVPLELLQSTLYLLMNHSGIGIVDIEDSNHFSRRLHATMGGLVDVIVGNDKQQPHQPTRVRLMHATVKSFIIESRWVETYIPVELSRHAAKDLWFYLGSQALLAVDPNESAVISDQLTAVCFPYTTEGSVAHHSESDDHRFLIDPNLLIGKIVKALYMIQLPSRHKIGRLAHVLCYSIIFVPPVCAKKLRSCSIDDELQDICQKLLKLKLVAWHFVLAKSLETYSGASGHLYDIAGSSSLPMDHTIQDLLLASAYRIYGYLDENMHRIPALEDQQRDEIVGTIIASSFCWPQRGSREWIKEKGMDTKIVPELVDRILAHLHEPSSFHLATYLVLGYENIPSYIQRLQLALRDHLPDYWSSLQFPKWANSFDATKGGRLRMWFPLGPPLTVWRAESCLRGQGRLAETQLVVLDSLGVDSTNAVPGQSFEPTPLTPYLMLERLLDPAFVESFADDHPHALSLATAIAKRMYQLEGRGAPFPDTPASLIDLDAAKSSGHMVFSALRIIQGLLVHHANEGHLPRPLPDEDEYNSQNFCDECSKAYSTTMSYTKIDQMPSVKDGHSVHDLCGIGSVYLDSAVQSTSHRQIHVDDFSIESYESMAHVTLGILLEIFRPTDDQNLGLVQGLLQCLPVKGHWNHLMVKPSRTMDPWSRFIDRLLEPNILDPKRRSSILGSELGGESITEKSNSDMLDNQFGARASEPICTPTILRVCRRTSGMTV